MTPTEREDTAAWVEERAAVLVQIAEGKGGGAVRASVAGVLRIEAAKLRGRAALLRLTASPPAPDRCPTCGGTEHLPPLPGTTGRRCTTCCDTTEATR